MGGVLIFLLGLFLQKTLCQEEEGKILATAIAFRDGEHTPIYAFPEDPWTDQWKAMGYRQLTVQGKQRMFQLGKWLRERYNTIIPKRYKRSAIYVGSTRFDEAITSANMVLAGLFPPLEDQIFDDSIKWQPIPVHIENDDYSNYPTDDEELEKMEAVISQLFDEAECNRDWLVHLFGVRINTKVNLYAILDAVMAAKAMNFTGRWTNEEMIEILELVVMNQLEGFTSTAKLARWRLEPFLYELTNLFGKFLPTPPKGLCEREFNAVLYAGGFPTMVNIIHGLKTLGVVEILERIPQFGTTLMFELKDGGAGKKYVTVFHKNSSGILHQYPVHNCGLNCDLESFITKILDILASKFEDNDGENYGNITETF